MMAYIYEEMLKNSDAGDIYEDILKNFDDGIYFQSKIFLSILKTIVL